MDGCVLRCPAKRSAACLPTVSAARRGAARRVGTAACERGYNSRVMSQSSQQPRSPAAVQPPAPSWSITASAMVIVVAMLVCACQAVSGDIVQDSRWAAAAAAAASACGDRWAVNRAGRQSIEWDVSGVDARSVVGRWPSGGTGRRVKCDVYRPQRGGRCRSARGADARGADARGADAWGADAQGAVDRRLAPCDFCVHSQL